jgi:hypothetical protein
MTEEWFGGLPFNQDGGLRADGIISRMYFTIYAFWDEVLNRFADPGAQEAGPWSKTRYRVLENTFDILARWGDDFKVMNGNIDEALKDSGEARRFTIGIMISICQTLTDGRDT